jgi:ribosomal protein S18 acetylase RimI-like enzyme
LRTGENKLSTLRPIQHGDRAALDKILRETEVFTQEEVAIALELIDLVIENPHQTDYYIIVAVSDEGAVQGYYCIGPTPATKGTYDLYWIAVDTSCHNMGIGKYLIRDVEDWVRKRDGKLIIAETSSLPKYENTRKFYLRTQYEELARIRDYYSAGDDLVIYGKYVSQHEA